MYVQLEFRKLKQTLAKNDYPDKIIDQEVEKFIKNRSVATTTTLQEPEPEQPPAQQVQTKYLVLPYINHKADEFASRLTKLVKNTFQNLELKVAFKAPNEVGKLFPFKDNITDKHLQSLVVYKITCETCNQFYIGKCSRILHHRIMEHNNEKCDSAIQAHIKMNPTHNIDANNIEIIDKADNNFKLMLKEMLHINKQKPELNTQHAAFYKENNKKKKNNKNKENEMFKSQLNTIIIARQS